MFCIVFRKITKKNAEPKTQVLLTVLGPYINLLVLHV